MMNHLTLTPLNQSDLDEIVLACKKIGWHKPKNIYEAYLEEQSTGILSVLIAKDIGKFCGYVTLKWLSDYPSFCLKQQIEIKVYNKFDLYRAIK
jgi:hypothetical protein